MDWKTPDNVKKPDAPKIVKPNLNAREFKTRKDAFLNKNTKPEFRRPQSEE